MVILMPDKSSFSGIFSAVISSLMAQGGPIKNTCQEFISMFLNIVNDTFLRH